MTKHPHVVDDFYAILYPRARQADTRSQTDHAHEFLWKKIVSQELWPGERVLDTTIAKEAGISRTPVREAIQRLVQDGLLDQLPRGVRVARHSAEEVSDLYDYRTALEVYAARHAAGRVPEEQLLHLIECVSALQRRLLEPGDRDEPGVRADFQRQDAQIHQLVLYSGGNQYIARAMASIHGRLSFFHAAGARLPDQMDRASEEQTALLRALLAQDVAAAGNAMEQHIQRVKRRILSGFFAAEDTPEPGQRRVRATDAGCTLCTDSVHAVEAGGVSRHGNRRDRITGAGGEPDPRPQPEPTL